MSALKVTLKSVLPLTAVLALLAAVPAPVLAKTHCRTHVVKVVVKKVVCDCKAITHKASRAVTVHTRRTVTRTAWHEPAYAGPPPGTVYVDESDPPVYGGNHALYVGEAATYSRFVRIVRDDGGCACGGDLTGRIDDGIYDGGVGDDDSGYGYGGGGYDNTGNYDGGYGRAVFGAFGGRLSSGRHFDHHDMHMDRHVSLHMGDHGHGGGHGWGGMSSGGGYGHAGMHSGGGHGHGGYHGGGHMGGGGHW